MSTFTWAPDAGASMERSPRIRSVQFGDGYEQRAPDGLNADLRKYSLTWSGRSLSEATAIETFLGNQGGTQKFDFTFPGDTTRHFVCKSWKVVFGANGNHTVTAEFQQVP